MDLKIMDKPFSMPMKDYLLRIMAVRLNIPEKTIGAIMEHQFDGVLEAMKARTIYSIEVSGFGKFVFNGNKAKKKFAKFVELRKNSEELLKDETLSESKKKVLEHRVKTLIDWEENIKPKLDGI